MRTRVSLFSYLADYLFCGAVFGGIGGFLVSTAAAEFGFPVIARIAFEIGLLAILLLVGLGIAGLFDACRHRLRGLRR